MRFQLTILLIMFSLKVHSQPIVENDQNRIMELASKCGQFSKINFDSAKYYGEQALALAERINFTSGKINALYFLGLAFTRNGDIPKALQLEFSGLQIAQENNLIEESALCYHAISKSYYFLNDYATSIRYGKMARQLFLKSRAADSLQLSNRNSIDDISIANQSLDNELVIGEAFMDSNQLDSALLYMTNLEKKIKGKPFVNIVNIFLGDAYFRSGNRALGMIYLRSALQSRLQEKDDYSTAWTCTILARCFTEINQPDSAIYYAKLGLTAAQGVGFKTRVLDASRMLANLYSDWDLKKANYYLNLSSKVNEEIFGSKKIFELQKTVALEQLQRQEEEKKQLAYENNIKQYSLISGIGVIIIIALILYRNNRQKQKANLVLETALNNLKSTQSQLIQSEKMASLGELTAGIAHEIQNPLNFVNNFSEVSNEMIKEIQDIRHKTQDNNSNTQEDELLNDIAGNLEKINHHGKRAADIVKGMLQHSRSSSGVKEPTDINALCDEYLRLTYHGLRAKDKSFNAEMKTDFDTSLPKVNIIPQDIGRVVLNLLANAFYAVNEKQKQNQGTNYEPTVTISTARSPLRGRGAGGEVLIRITDNGSGIPQKVKEKIFQPFFTTKPTGQGTGLGLSLSYDIVTKGHDGELKVETKVGDGTTFIIILPA